MLVDAHAHLLPRDYPPDAPGCFPRMDPIDGDTARHTNGRCFRHLPRGDPGDVPDRPSNRSAHVGRHPCGPAAHLAWRQFERGRHPVETARETEERTITARPDALDNGGNAALEPAILGVAVGEHARQRSFVVSFYDLQFLIPNP